MSTLTTQTSNSKKVTDYLATYGLWLATAALAVYQIAFVRELAVSLYGWWLVITDQTTLIHASANASALGQGVTLIMAVVAIAIIIGGFEYQRTRVGEAKALKVLAWVLGIQISLLALGLFI